MKQETATTIKKNHAELQHTLQEAGKLPPPQPVANQFEQVLQQEAAANPYLNALLHVVMSSN